MAKQPLRALLSIFGFVVWGDLGPLTLYRNKKARIVAFAKTWPHKPASPAQVIQRTRMIEAAQAWQNLSADEQFQWNVATRRACLCAHGYDLFCHWHMTQDTLAIRTLERQTRTTLLP